MKFNNFEKQNNGDTKNPEVDKNSDKGNGLNRRNFLRMVGLSAIGATLPIKSYSRIENIASAFGEKPTPEITKEIKEQAKQEYIKQINWLSALINSKEYEQRFKDKNILKDQKQKMKEIIENLVIVIESNPSRTIKDVSNKEAASTGAYFDDDKKNKRMHLPLEKAEEERYALELTIKSLVSYTKDGYLDIENSFTPSEVENYRKIQQYFKDAEGKIYPLIEIKVMMMNFKYDLQETLHVIDSYGEYITDDEWDQKILPEKGKIKNSRSLKLINTIPINPPKNELSTFVELIP